MTPRRPWPGAPFFEGSPPRSAPPPWPTLHSPCRPDDVDPTSDAESLCREASHEPEAQVGVHAARETSAPRGQDGSRDQGTRLRAASCWKRIGTERGKGSLPRGSSLASWRLGGKPGRGSDSCLPPFLPSLDCLSYSPQETPEPPTPHPAGAPTQRRSDRRLPHCPSSRTAPQPPVSSPQIVPGVLDRRA